MHGSSLRHYYKAQDYYRHSRLALALQEIMAACAKSPAAYEYQLLKARILFAEKSYASCIAAYHEISAQHTFTLPDSLRLAQSYMECGDFSSAESALKKILDSNSTLTEPKVLLARTMEHLYGPNRAQEYLSSELQLHPENVRLRYHRALLSFQLEQPAESIEDVNKCIAAQPSALKPRVLLFDCYIKIYGFSSDHLTDPVFCALNEAAYAERIFGALQEEDRQREEKLLLLASCGKGLQGWSTQGLLQAAYSTVSHVQISATVKLLSELEKRENGHHQVIHFITRLVEQGQNETAYLCLCALADRCGTGLFEQLSLLPDGKQLLRALSGRYSKERADAHIRRHFTDDLSKQFHGVFLIDKPTLDSILVELSGERYTKRSGFYYYQIPYTMAGYEGGYNGDQHALHWITVITLLHPANIITAYPSDGR